MIKSFYDGFDYLDWGTASWDLSRSIMYGFMPYDPIYNVLENFRRICLKRHIDIKQIKKSDLEDIKDASNIPMIIVVSSFSDYMPQFLELVEKGSNLLYVDSKTYYGSVKKVDEAKRVTLEMLNQTIQSNILNETVIDYGKGKVFCIDHNDINGFNADETKAEKLNMIVTVIEKIKRFNPVYMDINSKNNYLTHPVDQPLYIELELNNLSKMAFNHLDLEIEYPSDLEPLSSVLCETGFVNAYSSVSVPLFCKPVKMGKINDVIKVRIKNDSVCNKEFSIPFELTVLDDYRNLVTNKSAPKNVDVIQKLDFYENKLIPPINGTTFEELLSIDPEALVMKIRKNSEAVIKSIFSKKGLSIEPRATFESLINTLKREKFLDNKMLGFINTIRILGNTAVHYDMESPSTFTEEDAYVISSVFVLFIEECIKRDLI